MHYYCTWYIECLFLYASCNLCSLHRLIAKYRPTMPVLSVVIPRLKTNQLKWSFSGAFEVQPRAQSFFSYQKSNLSADGLSNAINSVVLLVRPC